MLSDLRAAYNLFADPRRRELVAPSAALGPRQKDLLDRALQVVGAGRMAEHDLPVLAWRESLGDEAGTAMPPRERPEPSPPGGGAAGDHCVRCRVPQVSRRPGEVARGSERVTGLSGRAGRCHGFTSTMADSQV